MESSESPRGSCVYVIVDPKGVPVEGFTPFTDLVDAMRAARALGTRNTVMKEIDGLSIPMAHQGPGGWRPKHRKDPYAC